MPKAKQASRRKKFNYSTNAKKKKKQFFKKQNPRIENDQIRLAWDNRKSTARNLMDMGLAFDPNKALPIKAAKMEVDTPAASTSVVVKPYVIHQMEVEASQGRHDVRTLSSDLIDYVQHMVREHGENYKAMARDEKNYYQDTPSQIRRKILKYQKSHPDHYAAFKASLNSS